MTLLPCPFCGHAPETFPKDPDREGDAWGEIRCVNEKCHVKPRCSSFDHPKPIDEAGRRWNKRTNGH